MRYVYLGDRMTAPELKNALCDPVRREDGRCIRGRGSQLVQFADGSRRVVIARRLRVVCIHGKTRDDDCTKCESMRDYQAGAYGFPYDC